MTTRGSPVAGDGPWPALVEAAAEATLRAPPQAPPEVRRAERRSDAHRLARRMAAAAAAAADTAALGPDEAEAEIRGAAGLGAGLALAWGGALGQGELAALDGPGARRAFALPAPGPPEALAAAMAGGRAAPADPEAWEDGLRRYLAAPWRDGEADRMLVAALLAQGLAAWLCDAARPDPATGVSRLDVAREPLRERWLRLWRRAGRGLLGVVGLTLAAVLLAPALPPGLTLGGLAGTGVLVAAFAATTALGAGLLHWRGEALDQPGRRDRACLEAALALSAELGDAASIPLGPLGERVRALAALGLAWPPLLAALLDDLAARGVRSL